MYLEQSEDIFRFAIPPNRAKVDDDDGDPENGDPNSRGQSGVPESD